MDRVIFLLLSIDLRDSKIVPNLGAFYHRTHVVSALLPFKNISLSTKRGKGA